MTTTETKSAPAYIGGSKPHLVNIDSLEPGNFRAATKLFEYKTTVDLPYGSTFISSLIRDLTATVHSLSGIKHVPRVNPNPGDLENKLIRINKATTQRTDLGGSRVSEHLRYTQLALMKSPTVGADTFAYGLLLHHGNYSVDPVEFAILLPEVKDNTPALLFKNGFSDTDERAIQTINDMIRFGWHF